MAGPEQTAATDEPTPADNVPGYFVSADHRDDCARFLEEVRTLVDRRREAGQVVSRLCSTR